MDAASASTIAEGLVTVGPVYVKFWTLARAEPSNRKAGYTYPYSLTSRTGRFGMAEAPRVNHCCAVVPDESGGVMTVTGGSNGTVYLWSGLDCIRSIPAAHDAMPVRSVAWANVKCGTPGSATAAVIDVVTGGEDGKVRCWAVLPGTGGRRPNMQEVVAVSAPPVDPAEALEAARGELRARRDAATVNAAGEVSRQSKLAAQAATGAAGALGPAPDTRSLRARGGGGSGSGAGGAGGGRGGGATGAVPKASKGANRRGTGGAAVMGATAGLSRDARLAREARSRNKTRQKRKEEQGKRRDAKTGNTSADANKFPKGAGNMDRRAAATAASAARKAGLVPAIVQVEAVNGRVVAGTSWGGVWQFHVPSSAAEPAEVELDIVDAEEQAAASGVGGSRALGARAGKIPGGRGTAPAYWPCSLVKGHGGAVYGLGCANAPTSSSSGTGNEGHLAWAQTAGGGSLFLTAGDDRKLMLWDAANRKIKLAVQLPAMARSVAWHPSSTCAAVGLINGGFVIVALGTLGGAPAPLADANIASRRTAKRGVGGTLSFPKGTSATSMKEAAKKLRRRAAPGTVVVQRQDCLEEISDIKFSPDGKLLGVASHDNFIDVYAVGDEPAARDGEGSYVLQARCEGHTSYITHFDWSADSKVLQSNCGAYEIIYWRASDGKPLRSTYDTVEADTDWDTFTCVLGFPVSCNPPVFGFCFCFCCLLGLFVSVQGVRGVLVYMMSAAPLVCLCCKLP